MRNVISFFAVVVATAVVTAFVTVNVGLRPTAPDEPHEWLHRNLDLSGEQAAELEKMEERYAVEEKRLRLKMAEANRALAEAIRADGMYSPKVAEAVERIHDAMGDLQKVSLMHLFEMTSLLDEEQHEKLMRYVDLALTQES